jgi:SAM-dependent methyltransferase
VGINLEFAATLAEIRGTLPDHMSVMELGAQDISADPYAVATLLSDMGIFDTGPIKTAAELYQRVGCGSYDAIDINGGGGNVHCFDLNRDIQLEYNFFRTFDLVTNLGTLEHCFDQASGFRNMHRLTKPGGIMIHCLPSQGLVNHAFYNYHPRLVAELAKVNSYEIRMVFFTADFTANRISYTIDNFRAHDSRDVLVYAVLKKTNDTNFKMPSDSMFTNREEVMAGAFRPYVKAPWSNILAQGSSDEVKAQ